MRAGVVPQPGGLRSLIGVIWYGRPLFSFKEKFSVLNCVEIGLEIWGSKKSVALLDSTLGVSEAGESRLATVIPNI